VRISRAGITAIPTDMAGMANMPSMVLGLMATAAFTSAAIPLDRLCGLKPVGFFGGFRFANEPILVSERQVRYSISYQRKDRPKAVSEFGFDFDQTMSVALLRGRVSLR
jgi:hypothetical protein